MSQRDSGYDRKALDRYETPAWVTEALLPHIPPGISHIIEPAAGSGKMVRVLEAAGYNVTASDIETGRDFLLSRQTADAIITNPPYQIATDFIVHALSLAPIVVMLLRTDFDHAKTRQSLFGDNTRFARKVVLTRRIKWFEESKGSPSFNHAWYIWNHQHKGQPTIAYGPGTTHREGASDAS